MNEGRKFGVCLFILGGLLILIPYSDSLIMIDKTYYVHGNVYQYYNTVYGLFFLTNSFSLLTGRYLDKKFRVSSIFFGLVIIFYAGFYMRIGGSFANTLSGGFAYDKLDVLFPEMVPLQYIGVAIFATGFSSLFQSYVQKRIQFYESDTELVQVIT